jgi:hypothetical protein
VHAQEGYISSQKIRKQTGKKQDTLLPAERAHGYELVHDKLSNSNLLIRKSIVEHYTAFLLFWHPVTTPRPIIPGPFFIPFVTSNRPASHAG